VYSFLFKSHFHSWDAFVASAFFLWSLCRLPDVRRTSVHVNPASIPAMFLSRLGELRRATLIRKCAAAMVRTPNRIAWRRLLRRDWTADDCGPISGGPEATNLNSTYTTRLNADYPSFIGEHRAPAPGLNRYYGRRSPPRPPSKRKLFRPCRLSRRAFRPSHK
jgi:hypothetical protein